MARTLPDELRSTLYDGSNYVDIKEPKKPKFKIRNKQSIFSSPINDTPINPDRASIFAQNIDKKENVFVKIKRCIKRS